MGTMAADASDLAVEGWEGLNPAAREKLELAQDLIRCYLASRNGLKKLGILRSERTLQGDYAEWLVAKMLQLHLAPSGVQKGYDATDSSGARYQIKARLVDSLTEPTSFDFHQLADDFDYLIGVFLDRKTFDVLGIIRIPYDIVRKGSSPDQNSSKVRFRWKRSMVSDPGIEKLWWPPNA